MAEMAFEIDYFLNRRSLEDKRTHLAMKQVNEFHDATLVECKIENENLTIIIEDPYFHNYGMYNYSGIFSAILKLKIEDSTILSEHKYLNEIEANAIYWIRFSEDFTNIKIFSQMIDEFDVNIDPKKSTLAWLISDQK